VVVSFPIVGDADGASLVAWTTTPWTLPSNLGLCVHPGLTYAKVKDAKTGAVYVLAASRLVQLWPKYKAPKPAAEGQ
jgi:isoleucyl-tRNA synthetase